MESLLLAKRRGLFTAPISMLKTVGRSGSVYLIRNQPMNCTIRYKADDRLTRQDQKAINCFHAMEGLEHLYPSGGFLDTGFRMWGIDGTARVLIEYTNAVRDRGLILEPVDIKKDLYGFVYAPKRNSCGVYNPFRNASAYHE